MDIGVAIVADHLRSRIGLGMVRTSHRTLADVDPAHEGHLGVGSGVDQPCLLVLALTAHCVPASLPPRGSTTQHADRRFRAAEGVVGMDRDETIEAALRVPEEHPDVNAAGRGIVHQVEEGAPAAGEPGISLQEGHAHPHRRSSRLDGRGDPVEGNRAVHQGLDQIP